MDGILKIHYEMAESSYFNMYKKAFIDHQSFRLAQTKPNEPVVQNITQKLAKPQTQDEGLNLLGCLLNQCNLDVIEQKGNIWIATCIKICNQGRKSSSASLAYDILTILIKKSTDIPELAKSFSSNYIFKICESLNKIEVNAYLSALKCIFISLKMYPGPCGGASRNLIENFLKKNFIDCADQNQVQWSGKCFHLLQQVRGGGVQGISHKESWKTYCLKLLGSMHNILDSLFANCPEFYDSDTEKEHLFLDPIKLNDNPIIRVGQLTTRFQNLTNYLITAIIDPYPVSKAFQPKKIIYLILRGLSVTCNTLQQNGILDNSVVGAVLPEIHIQLYKILESLILTLRTHLNIYHEQILGLFVDTLKWTSAGKSEGFKKPYSDLRFVTYNTLATWCQTMKFGSCIELVFEQLLKQIDNDIMPFRNEMVLQVLSGAKKHISKKARRQLNKAQNESSHLGQTYMKNSALQNLKVVYNDDENKNICYASLHALKQMYIYGSYLLKPLLIKEIQEKIIEICLTLNDSKNAKRTLYSNSLCREKIYDVLTSLITAPHHLCPPPSSLIIELLCIGQINDYNKNVRKCCASHLLYIEKILHPQKQILFFPPELSTIEDALKVQKTLESEDSNKDEEKNNSIKNSPHDQLDKPNVENGEIEDFALTQNVEEIDEDNRSSLSEDVVENGTHSDNSNLNFEHNGRIENSFVEIDYGDLSHEILENGEKSNSMINFEESMDLTIIEENKKAIPCPKKRLLQNIQNSKDSDIEIEEHNSPKRTRTEIDCSDKVNSNSDNINQEASSNSNVEETLNKNEDLFEEILATFTDELKDE